MHKRAKILLLFVGICLLSSSITSFALAAPSQPADVVNHKTKECAVIGTGDECVTCIPTGDWELLIGDCPDGYTKLDDFAPNSCTYSGNTNSMCDYAKERFSPKDGNPPVFLGGFVIVVLLLIVFTVLRKFRGVRNK